MTMRKFSKHTPEQIVVKLEKAEALRGEGMSTAQACRVLGISEATLCRWRQRYGSMNRSEAKELRELREQNARRRHDAVNHLVGQGFLSALHGRVAGLSRSAYCRTRAAGEAKTLRDHGPVRRWMNDCAAAHRRWGYTRAWARATSEGIARGA